MLIRAALLEHPALVVRIQLLLHGVRGPAPAAGDEQELGVLRGLQNTCAGIEGGDGQVVVGEESELVAEHLQDWLLGRPQVPGDEVAVVEHVDPEGEEGEGHAEGTIETKGMIIF